MYNFKNKNIGIIGLGLTGISAINFFRSNSKKIIAWDDTKEKRNNIILNEIEVLDLNLTKNLKQVVTNAVEAPIQAEKAQIDVKDNW